MIFPEDCLKYEKFQTCYDSGKGVVVLREGKPKSDPGPNEAFYSIWTETHKNEGPCQLRLWRYGSSSFSLSIPEMSDGMIRNAALAVLAACELGVSVQEISERLPLFRPSALRGKCFQGRGRSYFLVITQILPPCSTRSNILVSFKIGKLCISRNGGTWFR